MKYLLTACCIAIMLTSVTPVYAAQELGEEQMNEKLDLSEEIKMFEDFYENPHNIVFQDIEGNTVNSYVLENREAYYKDPTSITSELMDTVRSVEYTQIVMARGVVNKSIKRIKAYYTKANFVLCDAVVSLQVKANKITSGAVSLTNLTRNKANAYNVLISTKTINAQGTQMSIKLVHTVHVNKAVYNIETRHTITRINA